MTTVAFLGENLLFPLIKTALLHSELKLKAKLCACSQLNFFAFKQLMVGWSVIASQWRFLFWLFFCFKTIW